MDQYFSIKYNIKRDKLLSNIININRNNVNMYIIIYFIIFLNFN